MTLTTPTDYFCTPQLSDLISVRLLSGTSATLSFRSNNRSVQLSLLARPNMNQSKVRVSKEAHAAQ